MKLRRRTTGILVVAVAVIIIAPLTAYHYLDPGTIQISVTNGNSNYNFSGNYVAFIPNILVSSNFTSTAYATEKGPVVSNLTLSVTENELIIYETKNESYFQIDSEIFITGNFSGNLNPSSISLYFAINGPMANQTLIFEQAPFQPIPVEENVSYNLQQQFGLYGVGNRTQTINLLNQSDAMKNNSTYHFIYNTGIVADLWQRDITYGNLLSMTLRVSVNGLSSPMYTQIGILSYNSG